MSDFESLDPFYRPALETDEELRARVLYVAGDGEQTTRLIMIAIGAHLDAIAESYNLKRRSK